MKSLLIHPKTQQMCLTDGLSDQLFNEGWRVGLQQNSIGLPQVGDFTKLGFSLIELEPNDTIPHQFNNKEKQSRASFDLALDKAVPIY